jgi:hypothetical protein
MKLQPVPAPGIPFPAASKLRLIALLVSGLLVCPALLAQDAPPSQTKPTEGAAAPVLKVDAGPCMADFVVLDASGKGVYDAKITLQTQYGFLGLRKLDLNVGTNYEGKASIEGLPEKTKKPAQFKISQGGREKTVPYDPVNQCYAMHNITLDEPAENKTN